MRRVFVVILIIAAVIAFGWNKPFKDWTAQVHTSVTSWFDSLAR
jgi:Tfp pilus assembly protein PilO